MQNAGIMNRTEADDSQEKDHHSFAEATAESYNQWQECTKNPGHPKFIPASKFCMQDLPDSFRDEDTLKTVQLLCSLTVRLRVNNCEKAAVGTGRIVDVVPFDTACPCRKCIESENGEQPWWEIHINTANHVIGCTGEAKATRIDLFYDHDIMLCSGSLKTLKGLDVTFSDDVADLCVMRCALHDEALANKMLHNVRLYKTLVNKIMYHNMLEREKDTDFAIIVSHPHGRPKQVTIGRVTNAHIKDKYGLRLLMRQIFAGNLGQMFKDQYHPKSLEFERLMPIENRLLEVKYLVDTCPGSSGATTLWLGYTERTKNLKLRQRDCLFLYACFYCLVSLLAYLLEPETRRTFMNLFSDGSACVVGILLIIYNGLPWLKKVINVILIWFRIGNVDSQITLDHISRFTFICQSLSSVCDLVRDFLDFSRLWVEKMLNVTLTWFCFGTLNSQGMSEGVNLYSSSCQTLRLACNLIYAIFLCLVFLVVWVIVIFKLIFDSSSEKPNTIVFLNLVQCITFTETLQRCTWTAYFYPFKKSRKSREWLLILENRILYFYICSYPFLSQSAIAMFGSISTYLIHIWVRRARSQATDIPLELIPVKEREINPNLVHVSAEESSRENKGYLCVPIINSTACIMSDRFENEANHSFFKRILGSQSHH